MVAQKNHSKNQINRIKTPQNLIVFFVAFAIFFCQKTTAVSWCMWHKFHQHYNWLLTNLSAISYHMWLLLQLAQKIGQICCSIVYSVAQHLTVNIKLCFSANWTSYICYSSTRRESTGKKPCCMVCLTSLPYMGQDFFLNYQVVLLFSETKINVFLLFNHATILVIT